MSKDKFDKQYDPTDPPSNNLIWLGILVATIIVVLGFANFNSISSLFTNHQQEKIDYASHQCLMLWGACHDVRSECLNSDKYGLEECHEYAKYCINYIELTCLIFFRTPDPDKQAKMTNFINTLYRDVARQ